MKLEEGVEQLSTKICSFRNVDLKNDTAGEEWNEKQVAQGQYAIPVALLWLIVDWWEGKQGSGPEGDEVL